MTSDLTIRILQDLREELREHGGLLRSLDRRVGNLEERVGSIDGRVGHVALSLEDLGLSVRRWAGVQQRDGILLADEMQDVKRRLARCEDRLGIPDPDPRT